jgi:GT2 family glycosyltransferase
MEHILNWNGQPFLEQFLPAVVRYSGDHRVVVADNASTDHSVDYVREHFPQVEIVVNDQNGGFAKGYNDALKRVKANYYLLLNSDVEVTEGWLEPLIEAMRDPKVAGCQPKIKSYDRRNDFEHAGADLRCDRNRPGPIRPSGGYFLGDRRLYAYPIGRLLAGRWTRRTFFRSHGRDRSLLEGAAYGI